MVTNVLSASAGSDRLPAAAALGGAAVGVVYDTLGMPLTLEAAKAMTRGAIQAALERALAQLHHERVGSIDATALMDSIEVVFLIGRFHRDLQRKQPDLSKIDRDRWSSIEGVADVLQEVIGAMK